MSSPLVFLSAEWRALAMINFVVDPKLVAPHVPIGCEIDLHQGQTFVSLVGFMFLNTRVLGIPVPWHCNFEEVNLRFYVKRTVGDEIRRGVTFFRELVPRRAIAFTARQFYNEPYFAVPMSHRLTGFDREWQTAQTATAEYGWQWRGQPFRLSVTTEGPLQSLTEHSHEHFIAEHYWGYCAQRCGRTVEYQVEHPPWKIWRTSRSFLEGDFSALYGEPWGDMLATPPTSAFLAQGSAVRVLRPFKLPAGS